MCGVAVSYMILFDLNWKDMVLLPNKTGVPASVVVAAMSNDDCEMHAAEPGNATMSQFIAAMRGHLSMISPSEVWDSFLLSLAGKVQDPAASNDSLLTYMRLVLLVELKFILVKNRNCFQWAVLDGRSADVPDLLVCRDQARHFLREKSGITLSTGEGATVHVSGPWLPPVLKLSFMELRSAGVGLSWKWCASSARARRSFRLCSAWTTSS